MYFHELLLVYKQADQYSNFQSVSNGEVVGTSNDRYVYSGLSRASVSSPSAKRPVSKTTRSKNIHLQSEKLPLESNKEK